MMIDIMGDPHLGRRFLNDVPLDRRGEREEMVWADFEKGLQVSWDTKCHVMLGDIFDKVDVGFETVVRAADIYLRAAFKHTSTRFILLGGNHDQRRDGFRGPFDALKMMLAGADNIACVDADHPYVFGEAVFFSWHPSVPASELVGKISGTPEIAFGHWDVEDYGDSNLPNLIPTKALAERGITKAVTGHIHTADRFDRDGLAVVVHGSLQPFSFAEDPEKRFYTTLSLEEFDNTDPAEFKMKCVRVLLPDGAEAPPPPDCLQFKVIKADTMAPDGAELDVDMAQVFSTTRTLEEVLTEKEVAPHVAQQIRERILEDAE